MNTPFTRTPSPLRAAAAACALAARPLAQRRTLPGAEADHAGRALRARRRQRHPGARHRAAAGASCSGRPWSSTTGPAPAATSAPTSWPRAPADGYTLVIASNQVTINPVLGIKLPFKLEQDFAPVGLLASVPIVLVANPQRAVQDAAGVHALRQGESAASSATAAPATARRSTWRARCSPS